MKTLSKFKVLNAWHIKLIITFLMILNHLDLGYHYVSKDWELIFMLISRCVAPMFAYLVVEGIIYTKDLKKYCLRLFIWTFSTVLGNTIIEHILVNAATNINANDYLYLTIRANVCYTLLAGAVCISLLIWANSQKAAIKLLYRILAVACFVFGLFVEWGIVLLPFMLVTYFYKSNRKKRIIGYTLIEFIAILSRSEMLYFIVFPLISLYNGKRGPQNWFTKYFFYVFYPVHLWIIAIINFYLLSK